MRRGLLVLACVLIMVVLNGCGEKQDSVSDKDKQGELQQPAVEQPNESAAVHQSETESTGLGKTPPVIDHLDTYPFPVPSGWKEEKFVVRKYDEGMDWEAVFNFDGDEVEQALAYKAVIEELGYETQTLMSEVFKIGTVEFAGVAYHGTFTFDIGNVKISFTEKQRPNN